MINVNTLTYMFFLLLFFVIYVTATQSVGGTEFCQGEVAKE